MLEIMRWGIRGQIRVGGHQKLYIKDNALETDIRGWTLYGVH